MLVLKGKRAARYDLVNAGHRFMLAVLPLRHPQSRGGLDAFVQAAAACSLSSPDRDAVLLQLLSALEPHAGGRLPSLVDRYFALRRDEPAGLRRFERCVEDIIRYRGIGNLYVQDVIALIQDRYSDSNLRERSLAAAAGLAPSRLCEHFKAQTKRTTMEYLREVRLDHGARMLVEGNKSVKEISWAVGYKDAAHFNHDFKQRFRMSPTEHRARGIRTPRTSARYAAAFDGPANGQESGTMAAMLAPGGLVLVVDDDEGTRDALGFRLRRAGYRVSLASSAAEVLMQARTVNLTAVVLDVHLPDMDGLACLRELRRERPGRHPPVMLFTADYDVEEHAGEICSLGAMIVSKLCDPDELEHTLQSLLSLVTL